MDSLLAPQRLQRLREIAQDEGAILHEDASTLTPPNQRPTFRVPDDDRKADAVLGELRIQEAKSRPPQSGFKRAFSAGKKPETPYTPKELHDALTRVVDDNGLAGVAEVLLGRFHTTGGDSNYSRRASNGLVKKIRNADNHDERGRLLQTATELSRLDLVQLLAPYADLPSLDESLHISLNYKHPGIIETLLRYGANASLYQTAFQSAAENGECEILDLFLRSPKRVSPQCITQSLLPATVCGSLKAVMLLVRAGANCEYNDAAALMYAVQICRIDLTVALVMGLNPPSPKSLDRALDVVFSDTTSNMNDKHLLVEVLLCGGPLGNAANEGLFKATFLVNEEMMQLLLEYGVDINYNNACAVGHAIQRSRTDLVTHLLQNRDLRPDFASEVVGRIARTAPPPVKISILSMLLMHGASGHYCNELLVTAAEQDDVDTAQLLLSYGKDQNLPPVASVDYNTAQSLQIAVAQGNLPLVKVLTLDGCPSKFSLSKAFPMISTDNEESHFLLTQALLRAGAEGLEVDTALHAAVTSQQRSPRLVDLFIKSGVRVTGQTLISIVTQGSVDILRVLVSGKTSPATCSAAIKIAMSQHTKSTRYHLIKLLLPSATMAGPESTEVSQALIDLLQKTPEDSHLLKLLCSEGKANINFQLGQAVLLSTGNSDPAVLDVVLQSTGPPPAASTIARGLGCAIDLDPADGNRLPKVQALLRRGRPQEAINRALVQEIQGALRAERDLSVLKTLLASGADVNCSDGAPVCHAVRDPGIMDLILARRPSPHSLSMAFPLAMVMPEPVRYDLCEKLLKAGAVGPEISKALYVVVKEGQPALQLMTLLLPQADVNHRDGRILKSAVRGVFRDGVDLLLTQRPLMPTVATRIRAFQEAMMLPGTQDRFDMVKKLLDAGTKGDALSEALITAANWKDIHLTELLLKSGASVDYNGGKAIHSAASSGSRDILQALISGQFCLKPSLSTLTAGFGGAMSLKEKDRDSYYSTLQVLLAAGMKGEAVDAALVEAVKEGDSNIRLTELIYSNGASVEWKDGEALDIAVKNVSIDTLTLLLQAKPSQIVMKRAYRSSLGLLKGQRYLVIERILKAGKAIDKHVTNTLFKATHENPADCQLIQLLLNHNVFDEGESMAHAADVLDHETLTLLTDSPRAKAFVSPVFRDVMATGKPWQSNKGMAITELLLERGATGEAVGEAFVNAIERCESGADTLANDFLDLLLRFEADVNYQRGLPLQRAAQQANVDLIQKLIPGATADSKAMAIYYLFKSSSDESSILQMIEAFTAATDAERRLDIDFTHPDPDLEPVLFMALRQYPRKPQVLKALLDNGFSPDQWLVCEVDENIGEEAYNILCWAIAQPEKRISSANIELLIDSGANVSFTSKLGISPVMLSIKNQRPDILEKLISRGAKVTVADRNGITPLALASQVGNSVAMAHLLKAGAEIDDGSLHDASRELRCEAMRVLIRFNHEVDFPSDRHEGRSALAELCLKAVDNGPTPVMEEAIECLIANGADVRLRCHGGKTIFHFALDSSDPLTILKILVKLLWKIINDDSFLFDDGKYTYSLTKYVEKGLSSGPQVQQKEIIEFFHQKRVIDKFWANDLDSPQPSDLCGAPQHILDEVNRQKSRARRLSEQRQEALQQIELKRLTAIEENRLLHERTDVEIRLDLEKARMQDRILETRADQQLRLDSRAELERQRLLGIKHNNELNHVKAIGDTQFHTQRRIGEAKIANQQTENMLAIEYVQERTAKENEGAMARRAIENGGREDAERIQMRMHEREMARLRSQKQLVDSNAALAGSLQGAGMNQRQIGYITGEVG